MTPRIRLGQSSALPHRAQCRRLDQPLVGAPFGRDPSTPLCNRLVLACTGQKRKWSSRRASPRPGKSRHIFYVRPGFRVSSLSPPPEAGKNDKLPAELQRIQVPVVDAYGAIASLGTTYLMVDIEGGEMDLLRHPLPDCVKTVCVELHTEPPALTFNRRRWSHSFPATSTSTSAVVFSPYYFLAGGAARSWVVARRWRWATLREGTRRALKRSHPKGF
jgi:hypothetical protein